MAFLCAGERRPVGVVVGRLHARQVQLGRLEILGTQALGAKNVAALGPLLVAAIAAGHGVAPHLAHFVRHLEPVPDFQILVERLVMLVPVEDPEAGPTRCRGPGVPLVIENVLEFQRDFLSVERLDMLAVVALAGHNQRFKSPVAFRDESRLQLGPCFRVVGLADVEFVGVEGGFDRVRHSFDLLCFHGWFGARRAPWPVTRPRRVPSHHRAPSPVSASISAWGTSRAVTPSSHWLTCLLVVTL